MNYLMFFQIVKDQDDGQLQFNGCSDKDYIL